MLEEFATSNAIAFIDPAVPDYQRLIAGVVPGTQVFLLDPMRDGIGQITQVLNESNNIANVHIISHGEAGSLQLGASHLGLDNLNNYAEQLQHWASALTPDADILVYGCDVAAGETGNDFVQQLSQLTGADVAASDDLTGGSALQADWDLEVETGSIEAALAFQPEVMQAYNSVFASANFIGQATIASDYDYAATRVGGISGITYDAINNRYYAISDDKNNVRFYTLNINLSSGSLPSSEVTFTGMTTLKDAAGNPLASNISDTEGIAFTSNGNAFISSEGLFSTNTQQFINRFNLATGNQNLSLPIDSKFAVSGDLNNGIRNNRGFESTTITPEGKYLFTVTEAALEQDSTSASGGPSRIVKYNLSTGLVEAEFVYNSDSGNGISELLAVDGNTLLAIDRNLTFGIGKLYQVSLQGATNIQSYGSINGVSGITPVQKSLVTDLSGFELGTNFEGMTFGPTLPNGKRSLILVADNNFGSAGFLNNIPTRFAAFEFTPDTPSFTVINTNDTGIGSLRQAIADANAAGGINTIDFKIPTTDPGYNSATGTFTIKPKSALPEITDPVIIDGSTQTGFSTKPIIELDGSSAGTASGLTISAGNSKVKGLIINRFSSNGIVLRTNGGNVIETNYIGTDVSGTIDLGNGGGIDIDSGSANNIIGGTSASSRNIISGNNSNGIFIHGLNPGGNQILGNYIGTNVTGTVDLGNTGNGIGIDGVPNNIIRGNVISGNDGNGIALIGIASSTQVQANFIGTSSNGTVDLGNSGDGVQINSANNIIGGTSSFAGNIISGNNQHGIRIAGNGGNQVLGNYIGTNAAGTADVGNTLDGIIVNAPNNTIGGTTTQARNLISGNDRNGVYVQSGISNRILSNSIFSNSGLGIDLGTNGVTANDAGDADTGANNLQNFPILTSVNGSTVTGILNSNPGRNYRLEFFANTNEDPSKYGEGEVFLGFQNITTNASGDASFNFNFTPISGKAFITATATLLDASNNPVETSEFSRTPIQAGTLEFTAATYNKLEGNSGGAVNAIAATVKRTGGSSGIISVPVRLSATVGTATPGSDYTNNFPITVTFGDGDTAEKQVVISIVGDTTLENAETINLELGTPTGGAIIGTQKTAVFTIENDDTAANNPPAIDLNGSDSGTGYNATFTRGTAGVAIVDSAKLSVTDDGANINSARVAIANLLNGAAETLTVNTSGTGIVSSYSNGVLTLTGNAPKEQYQQVLRTISYRNTALIPNTTNRTINFLINDGSANSAVATTTLAINSPMISLGSSITPGTRLRPPISSVNNTTPDVLYSFNVSSSTRVVAHLALSGGNANLALLNSSGAIVRSSENAGTLSENLDQSGLTSGTYYMRVYQASAGEAPSYKLSLNFA